MSSAQDRSFTFGMKRVAADCEGVGRAYNVEEERVKGRRLQSAEGRAWPGVLLAS